MPAFTPLEVSYKPKEESLRFKDCADILQSGVTESGVYSIHLHNSTQTVKVVRLKKWLAFSYTYHLIQCVINNSLNTL